MSLTAQSSTTDDGPDMVRLSVVPAFSACVALSLSLPILLALFLSLSGVSPGPSLLATLDSSILSQVLTTTHTVYQSPEAIAARLAKLKTKKTPGAFVAKDKKKPGVSPKVILLALPSSSIQ